MSKSVDTVIIASDRFDRVPRDRCAGIFLAFFIHGLGCFLPWNLLFHSYEYFSCCKIFGDDAELYRQHFLSFCALAALLAALVATGTSLFIGFHGDTKRRIVPSIVVLILMFILQVLFAVFDARDSSGVFLCVTILNIVVIGAFTGLYLSSVSGIVSYFPDRYVNAIIIGTSFSILVSVCARVSLKHFAEDSRSVAIYFLVASVLVLLLCFDIYFALPYSRLFRFYHTSIKLDLLQVTKGRLLQVPYGTVLRETWIQCFSVWLHYFTTVTLFPSILSQVESTTKSFLTTDVGFIDAIVFLNFAISNFFGNVIAGFIRRPYSRWIFILVFIRSSAFLVGFVFINFEAQSRLYAPVLIKDDRILMSLIMLFGLTHGYLNSMLQMLTVKSVEPYLSPTAAVIIHLFLFAGCFCGIIGSFLYHFIITLL